MESLRAARHPATAPMNSPNENDAGVGMRSRRGAGRVRKYLRIFAFAVRNAVVYVPSFLLRNIFLLVIIFVFYSLWRVIYAGQSQLAGFSMTQIVWYLTFTECIELSKSRVLADVQEEVKDGTLAYSMQRPYSYLGYHFSRSLGESIVKMVPILLMGAVTSLIFVGPLPGLGSAFAPGLLVLFLGVALNTAWYLLIGLLAFWTEEATPFYWIFQKLVFVVGGMFFPIDLFPSWMQTIAKALPFAFSAYWPAKVIVDFSLQTFFYTLRGQAIYLVAVASIAAALYKSGARRVLQQGG